MRFAPVTAIVALLSCVHAADAMPSFKTQVIDDKVAIGYATAIADIDGDGKPDILLVDKKQICWYKNPTWEKHVICENVTKQDDVCIAALDITGTGKASIAIGAEWNPGDTVNSGSVHYLIPPEDRTQKWEVVTLPHEPVVHRMKWVEFSDGKFKLVVLPLHGRGNKNAQGEGVKVLAYEMPADPKGEWKTSIIDDTMHLTHNMDPMHWAEPAGKAEDLVIAGREGILLCLNSPTGWIKSQIIADGAQNFKGAGEVRVGHLTGGAKFLATVEPFHGTQAAIYTAPKEGEKYWQRRVIDPTLKEGHAVACADFLKTGSDQVLVGWRIPNGDNKVGINFYMPPKDAQADWTKTVIDDNKMACEDIAIGDLDGDGRIDFVASGRATHNLVIYWNKSGDAK